MEKRIKMLEGLLANYLYETLANKAVENMSDKELLLSTICFKVIRDIEDNKHIDDAEANTAKLVKKYKREELEHMVALLKLPIVKTKVH